MSHEDNNPKSEVTNFESAATKTAALLVGAAAGSKIADKTAGGKGLASVFAQIGGAILGVVAVKRMFKYFAKDDHQLPK